eukprot:1158430-Pelagomonas_calceolata.AAC.1
MRLGWTWFEGIHCTGGAAQQDGTRRGCCVQMCVRKIKRWCHDAGSGCCMHMPDENLSEHCSRVFLTQRGCGLVGALQP